MYCPGCLVVFENDLCPVCGSKKNRPVQAEDICFLAEEDCLQAGILEDFLKQEGIPMIKKSTIGAGMAMKAGVLFERFRFYTRYEHLDVAREILSALHSS